MNQEDMIQLFQAHRDAEARRDYDAILDTFADDCFLETIALGLRSEGRKATRAAYTAYFTAFPDLAPEDQGMAVGDDVVVVWGILRGTSLGEWLGLPPSGRPFSVRFANVAPFKNGKMAGESVYYDLASLCEEAGLPLEKIRLAAKARSASTQ